MGGPNKMHPQNHKTRLLKSPGVGQTAGLFRKKYLVGVCTDSSVCPDGTAELLPKNDVPVFPLKEPQVAFAIGRPPRL